MGRRPGRTQLVEREPQHDGWILHAALELCACAQAPQTNEVAILARYVHVAFNLDHYICDIPTVSVPSHAYVNSQLLHISVVHSV